VGRWVGIWLPTVLAIAIVLVLVVKLVLPRRRMLIPGRAVLLLLSTLALGPGLLANVILKDNWSRPRPIDVTEFQGEDHFVPWWDPRGDCPKNCSFIAGEPSGAFWTLAVAAVTPPPWQALAYGAALLFGAGVGLVRLAGGGHFASDIVFSGVFTFLVIWAMHGVIYRWRPTRITDQQVERAIERVALPGYEAMGTADPASARRFEAPRRRRALLNNRIQPRSTIQTVFLPPKQGGLQLATSAPADAIDRAAAVHRRASADANTARADTDAGNRTSPQHHAAPCDATGRITYVCAVDDGAGWLRGCGDETGCQQRSGS